MSVSDGSDVYTVEDQDDGALLVRHHPNSETRRTFGRSSDDPACPLHGEENR